MVDFEKIFNKSHIRRVMNNPPREETLYKAFHNNYEMLDKDQLEDILNICTQGFDALKNELTYQISLKKKQL